MKLLRNKKVIAALIAVVAVLAGGLFWFANRKTDVLDNEVSTKISGYNTQGDFTIDGGTLVKKIATVIADKEKLTDEEKNAIVDEPSDVAVINGESAEDYLEGSATSLTQEDHERIAEYMKLIKSVSINTYKSSKKPEETNEQVYRTGCSGLRNGDSVTVSVRTGDGVPVAESEKTYKVSGLKKIRKYKVSSLYKYMHLRTGGVEGSENCYAHVYMDKKIHDIIGYGAGTPDVGETPRILKNGDSITSDIESWTRYVNKCLYNKGRQLIYDNKTLTFTVRGLASPKTVDCKDVLSELDKMAGNFSKRRVFLENGPSTDAKVDYILGVWYQNGNSSSWYKYDCLKLKGNRLVKGSRSTPGEYPSYNTEGMLDSVLNNGKYVEIK